MFTQDDIDKLDAAIAASRGVSQTTFENQTTVFRPVEELQRLRAMMKREVDASPTHRFAVTDKGT
jgi:hypothetical protein